MAKRKDDELAVMVAFAPNEITASMWAEVLRDEGIAVMLQPGGAGMSFGSVALIEHHLYVRADQADLAREILAELGDETMEFDDESEPSDDESDSCI